MSKLVVSVTAGDIEIGDTGACQTCPVAHALARATGATWVSVNGKLLAWRGPRSPMVTVTAPTTPRVRDFIRRFDDGAPVKPLEFELEIPEP